MEVEQKLSYSLEELIKREGGSGAGRGRRGRGSRRRFPQRRGPGGRNVAPERRAASGDRPATAGGRRGARRLGGRSSSAPQASTQQRLGRRSSRRRSRPDGKVIDKRAAIARLRAALATAESLAEARRRRRVVARRRSLAAIGNTGKVTSPALGRGALTSLARRRQQLLERNRLQTMARAGPGRREGPTSGVPTSMGPLARRRGPDAMTDVADGREVIAAETGVAGAGASKAFQNPLVDKIKIITELAAVPEPLLAQQQQQALTSANNFAGSSRLPRKVVSGEGRVLSLSERFS